MKTINKKVMYIIAVCVLILCVVASIFGIKYLLIGNIKLNLSDAKISFNINTSVNLNALADETVVPSKTHATVPIFMYHFILEDYGEYPDTENFLKPETLEEQLKYISENGYQTIYIDEMDDLYKYEP